MAAIFSATQRRLHAVAQIDAPHVDEGENRQNRGHHDRLREPPVAEHIDVLGEHDGHRRLAACLHHQESRPAEQKSDQRSIGRPQICVLAPGPPASAPQAPRTQTRPSKAMKPPSIHAAMTSAGELSPWATTAGLTKIPTPTMPPITSITALGNPIATLSPSPAVSCTMETF